MGVEFAPDPEVEADLQLRADSLRDRRRSRKEQHDWKPAPTVCYWRCRGGCARMVEITQEAIDALSAFEAILAKRGEQPLDTGRIAFCDECRSHGRELAGDANRNHVDATARAIRDLRDAIAKRDGPREREVVERLRKLSHPDLDELIGAVRAKLQKQTGKNREAF